MKKSKFKEFTDEELKMCKQLHVKWKYAGIPYLQNLYSKTMYSGKTKTLRTSMGTEHILEQPLSDEEANGMIELAEKIDLYIQVR